MPAVKTRLRERFDAKEARMPAFDSLIATITHQPDLARSIEALITGLAERMKAASNDQNVQRLARDVRAAAPDLAQAVTAKAQA